MATEERLEFFGSLVLGASLCLMAQGAAGRFFGFRPKGGLMFAGLGLLLLQGVIAFVADQLRQARESRERTERAGRRS